MSKKEDIKEAEVEEIKYNYNEQKPKKKGTGIIIFIVVFILIILLMISLLIELNNVGLLKFNNPITTSNKKAELKYTETNTKIKEGVYITDVSDVVEEVMPSIVAITSKTLISSGSYGPSFFGGGQQYYATGAGSGIIISQTDDEILILTNNHVVEDAEELSVQFINEKNADAKIKGTSAKRDIAVIAVKTKDLDKETLDSIKIATIGDSTKLKVGNGVIAIGNALGYGQSVTTGVVSALDREVTVDNVTNKMIQIDAAINGGNSGGALLNNAGEVVGINSVKYSSSGSSTTASIEGMGFAIPISNVKEIIETLMNGETVEEEDAKIGIEGYMITDTQAQYNNSPIGFYISKIVDGTGADKAGLEIGNIITEIEGKKVEKVEDITSVLYDKKKGDKITLKISYISRNSYKEKDVEVTLS